MAFVLPTDNHIEIGAKRSRLVLTLTLVIAGLFLSQLVLYRLHNPRGELQYYFDTPLRGSSWAGPRAPAPDPLTQLLWLSGADAVGRLWLWQFVSFGFVHSGMSLWHLFLGVFGLWLFGPEVEARAGRFTFLLIYLGANAVCGMVSVAAAPQSPTMGCLASSLALAGAFWAYFPGFTVRLGLVPMRTRDLVIIYACLAALVCVIYWPDEFNVVCWAHLFGLPFGWVAGRLARWARRQWLVWELQRDERDAAEKPLTKIRVDALLAKVKRGGIRSLTLRERIFLHHASRRFRDWIKTDGQPPPRREADKASR